MTPTPTQPLTVGEQAPDFTLVDQTGTVVTLSKLLADRPVVIVFYPFAFSGICTGELTEIRDDLGAFDNPEVQVVAISCDPIYSLRAWADREAFFFPLLSDFWPHGQVARDYGVFHDKGFAGRGTFLVGRDGRIAWTLVTAPGDRRDFGALPEAVSRLAQAGRVSSAPTSD